jgi:hypothetical protein
MQTIRRSAEEEIAIQAEKLLLLSRAVVAPAAERHAAIARLQSTPHHLNLTQIYSQIGATSMLCRLEENQAMLLQLSATVQKLAQTPPTTAPMSTHCRLEDNQALLVQLTTTVEKLAATPVVQPPVAETVDAEAEAFKQSWLFRLWRLFAK